jgi:alpha-beta hydrolase superfamily lysophospholipase
MPEDPLPSLRKIDVSPLLPRIEFYTARDGRRLAVRRWDGIEPARARVVFLHGIISHGGWYTRSCGHLSECGFEVHFLDRRGSGLNAQRRGDVDRYTTWLDDVTTYLEQLGTERPVVLCGISWGGKLAAAVARREPRLACGLVLITPGLYSHFEPGLLQRLALRIPVRQRMQARQLEIPIQRGLLYTDTPKWRDYIDRDPLALREVTFRIAQADNRLARFAKQGAPAIHTPTLMMLAGRDRILKNARCRDYLGRIGASHKTLIEYSNAVHTLEFENEPERYCADLADWIGRVIAE